MSNTIPMRIPREVKNWCDEINRGVADRQIKNKLPIKPLHYAEIFSKLPKVPGLKEFMAKEIKI